MLSSIKKSSLNRQNPTNEMYIGNIYIQNSVTKKTGALPSIKSSVTDLKDFDINNLNKGIPQK